MILQSVYCFNVNADVLVQWFVFYLSIQHEFQRVRIFHEHLVTFDFEKRPKGPFAVNVKLVD